MNLMHGITQVFLAFDQLLNVLSNPFSDQTWCDETLSARCGRLGHRYASREPDPGGYVMTFDLRKGRVLARVMSLKYKGVLKFFCQFWPNVC